MARAQQTVSSQTLDPKIKQIDHVAEILKRLRKDSKYKEAAELAITQWNNTMEEMEKLRSKDQRNPSEKKAVMEQEKSMSKSSEQKAKREQEKDMRIVSLEQQVKELTHRLSTIAGDRLSDANSDITDLSDPYRPTKLAEMFREVYNDEWTEAFQHYDTVLNNEDKILDNLVFIPKDIYHFCRVLFDQQSEKLDKHMQGMFSVMTDPVFQIDGTKSVRVAEGKDITAQISVRKDGSPTDASDEAKKEAEMLIKKFQKTMAASSTSDLFELYSVASSLNGNSEWIQHVTSNAALQKFASKLLKIIWLMISQNPPICLKWLEPETKVDKNSFTFYRISGETVRRTIWPAVYLHATGPLMAKGVVQPNRSEEEYISP